MPEFSAGRVEFDPASLEAERARFRAPLRYAAMAAPIGGALGAATRVPVLAQGAMARARQQAMANALRGSRSPQKGEEVAERIFMP